MFKIVYVPLGVGTFEMISAHKALEDSIKVLKDIDDNVIVPSDILLTIDSINSYMDNNKDADLVIIENITFANALYTETVLGFTKCPIILWGLREPVIDGTRLRLNSLTGSFSASNMMKSKNRLNKYIFGSPDEVKDTLKSYISAFKAVKALEGLNLLVVGESPDGFKFGDIDKDTLYNNFKANLINVPHKEMMDKARSYKEEELTSYKEEAFNKIKDLDKIDSKNVIDFVRLYKAYKDYCVENNIKALSTRCWPNFFTEYGTPVCSVLGLLNDELIASSCEGDSYGAISMYIGSMLSNNPTFFGDPVSLNENESTITFWHCGTGACSLAKDDNAYAGVHCNRKIGPTLEFGCKESNEATMFRIGHMDNKIRVFATNGKILDKPKQFFGTSLVFKSNCPSKEVVNNLIELGFEPHYVICYKDIVKELEVISDILGFEFIKY